jgi:DNA-binding CsgD family transcriptional regulator/tetratricopeptide (TPR) repeat protein
MSVVSGRRGSAAGLTDRRAECSTLDRLIEAVRAGESRTLVVRGDPGVGKTVLLDYAARQARGFRVARVAGVQSEMELAFAGLHQLCTPMLGRAERLPEPQRDALRTAFGLSAGPTPDRLLVGLGVLSLLSEVAGQRPLICLVDDEQWLDRASTQALGFAARRLGADPVGLVFAARELGADLAGLPELEVDGLPAHDARALLASVLTGPLDARVRDLIVAETRGNPLALLELPRGLTPAELAGGFGLPGAPLTGRIEASFTRQLEALPSETRRLLQLAAADPSGDRSLVWRAARRLGIPVQAAEPGVEEGMVEFGSKVRFRHPLARSAAYRSASLSDRQQIHAALAEVTDPAADPDRRAWHHAQAAAGPDEEVATELERSAGRAQARGGLAAAAAFLERSVQLTADPTRLADRALAAAQASVQAGAFDRARELLATAEAGPLHEFASARVDLMRGQIAFAMSRGGDAPALLLKAAKRLEPLNRDLARDTYLTAWMAAGFAGNQAGADDMEVSRAAQALPPPTQPPHPLDLLLDGLTLLVTDGPAVAAPPLRQSMRAFASADIPAKDVLQFGWMASTAADVLWDEESWRQVRLTRAAGALEQLPVALIGLAMDDTRRGDFAGADALLAEADAVCEATGGARIASGTAAHVAALRGNQAEVTALVEAVIAKAEGTRQGASVNYAHWVTAILYLGLGHYANALAAAQRAAQNAGQSMSIWVLPDLIEAAARSGNPDIAAGALNRLATTSQAGGTDFGLGLEARCRALVNQGAAAEDLYREAIERLGRTRLRPDLARAHLLYGEWLRRVKRRADARAQLRTAHKMLDAIGMETFAERARRELMATGETIHKRSIMTIITLTAQEAHIARLAADGLSNPEIGARLFLSARTIEWHLSHVFTKLGIGSRRELRTALAQLTQDAQPT